MKNKKVYLMIMMFLVALVLVGCKKNNKKDDDKGGYTVKFVVVAPENTPANDKIHIAGTLSKLGLSDWDPEDINAVLTKVDGNYEINFELDDDFEFPVTISYKYARGDWGKVEKGSQGEELRDRTVTIDGTTKNLIINDTVRSWADLYESSQTPTIVGNLDIVEMTYEQFPSAGAKTRKIRIWTPSSYDGDNNELNYPVIYMHDAQNLFNRHTSFAGEWEVDETIEALMVDFDFDGVIVVGIDNSPARMGELVYDYPFLEGAQGATKTGDIYMDFIVDVVKPYVDENYNTLTDRENTYIGGSSLGGLMSFFGGLAHLDTFGGILAFSSSTQLVDEEELDDYFVGLNNTLLKETKFFLYVGTSSDGNVNWPTNYKNKLKTAGVNEINIEVVIGEGQGHNEAAWKKYFPNSIKWIFDLED